MLNEKFQHKLAFGTRWAQRPIQENSLESAKFEMGWIREPGSSSGVDGQSSHGYGASPPKWGSGGKRQKLDSYCLSDRQCGVKFSR